MPDYSLGKIYCVRNTIDNEIYVGSTIQAICRRMAAHRLEALTKPTKKIHKHMVSVGVDKFYIELVEKYPCQSNEELHKKEGEWIRQIGTLNSCIAGRTHKEYRVEDPEHYKQKDKKYREKHHDHLYEYLDCPYCGCKYLRKHKSRHQKTNYCVAAFINC